MSSRDDDRFILDALHALPAVEPDASQAARVRAACRKRIDTPSRDAVTLEPVTFGTVCAMYLWQVVRIVVR